MDGPVTLTLLAAGTTRNKAQAVGDF